jgi:hypothetical protein
VGVETRAFVSSSAQPSSCYLSSCLRLPDAPGDDRRNDAHPPGLETLGQAVAGVLGRELQCASRHQPTGTFSTSCGRATKPPLHALSAISSGSRTGTLWSVVEVRLLSPRPDPSSTRFVRGFGPLTPPAGPASCTDRPQCPAMDTFRRGRGCAGPARGGPGLRWRQRRDRRQRPGPSPPGRLIDGRPAVRRMAAPTQLGADRSNTAPTAGSASGSNSPARGRGGYSSVWAMPSGSGRRGERIHTACAVVATPALHRAAPRAANRAS